MTETNGEYAKARRASEAILVLVDVVHVDNENEQHTDGFCVACSDFYVALNALTIEHTEASS